ncbi:MAG TPA: PA2778 family cysteine peptidase [Methylophilus sp.]|uniref:PA2778 family cysteine peptidase n=1 Tax=Methylophilus sp. TaxID=29541 RepID=UPI002C6EC16A|nr:PA2778 family cysteine peptidase [Methylophilus sp.]HSH86426.1 PA2778 family cysteine peptidase [Methylophilus sp.]
MGNIKASLARLSMLAFLCLLTACAATGVREATQNSQLPRRVELTQTPFFPQDQYQCGPAALATALTAVHIPATPEQLTPEVYVPSRQGSLQIEMLAAARRHGAVAVQIPAKLEAIMQEVASGHVVIVMQNLGLSWVPSWHYAVVIGYDADQELVWLRSGPYKRQEMSLSAFQRTWARSEYWAFVALPPGQLPASASADDVAKALVAYEKNAPVSARKKAYQVAVEQWPDHLVLLMGLGNAAYAAGDLPLAATSFKHITEVHPESAAAYNNLANVLLAQNQITLAETVATKGQSLAGSNEKLKAQIDQTLVEIRQQKK